MQSAEIELKFPISDLARLQSQLPGLGFLLDTPRTFEQNTLYDTPERTLRQSKQILRIRHYGDIWTLTHKRNPLQSTNNDPTQDGPTARYKVRIETETRIQDGPELGAVFEQLGYAPVFRYEKFRTEWSQSAGTGFDGPLSLDPLLDPMLDPMLDPTLAGEAAIPAASRHLVIDETPIGDYAELEGPPGWIDETIARLGVDPASCITDSYGRLFLAWKQTTGSGCENLTFDEVQAAAALQPTPG